LCGHAEVETGFEPVYTALQAVASPLGHSTEVEASTASLRADDGTRTRDPHLGKVMRYQLRYVRARPRRRRRVAHSRLAHAFDRIQTLWAGPYSGVGTSELRTPGPRSPRGGITGSVAAPWTCRTTRIGRWRTSVRGSRPT
jgi:hypothetical protein